VCAVDTVLVEDVITQLGLDAEVITSDPHRLSDLYDDIRRIGSALDRETAAADLVTQLRERVDAVRRRAERTETRPRVAVSDWMDPVMLAGHWVPELVDIAGGRYDLVDPGGRSTPWEFERVVEYDPEVAVVAPCGFELDQTREHREELTDRSGWAELSAVRSGRVHLMDGHNYVNRPGPRLVDTLEYLAGVVHPEAFPTPPGDAVETLHRQHEHH
jgi:iron complex transport system substrate-binding protein